MHIESEGNKVPENPEEADPSNKENHNGINPEKAELFLLTDDAQKEVINPLKIL